MYKWVLGIVGILSIIAIVVVLVFGLKPKAVPVIKPSNFEEPDKLAVYIHRQLFQRLKTTQVLVFGFDTADKYQKKVVDRLVQLVLHELQKEGKPQPDIMFVSADQSYSKSTSSRIEEITRRYSENILSFSFYSLKNIESAPELINCQLESEYTKWLDCTKSQKVRQILNAKKADPSKTTAVVENQTASDVMVYIR